LLDDKKKAGLELLPSQLIPPLHRPLLNHGDGAYGVDKLGGRCSSTAVRCNSKYHNTDTPHNSCMGNIRNNRNSCIGMLGTRLRLKPERQLVSPEPEPVRLLPMEVKAVFSCFLCGFVCSRGMQTPAKERIGACVDHASASFYMNRMRAVSRPPVTSKKRGLFGGELCDGCRDLIDKA
jgi:hypothetical protein